MILGEYGKMFVARNSEKNDTGTLQRQTGVCCWAGWIISIFDGVASRAVGGSPLRGKRYHFRCTKLYHKLVRVPVHYFSSWSLSPSDASVVVPGVPKVLGRGITTWGRERERYRLGPSRNGLDGRKISRRSSSVVSRRRTVILIIPDSYHVL